MNRGSHQQRRSGRSEVRLLRRPGFWSGFAAALGLAATLWATLVGQTVPELLTNEKAELVSFQKSVQEICAGVEQWSHSRSADSLRALLGPSTDSTERRGVASMYDAQAGWARLEAPQIYAREYAEFRRGWTAAFGALYFDFPGSRAYTVDVVRWRLGHHTSAIRKNIDRSLTGVNRSLGTVIVASIAMSVPACRRAADRLRDEVAEAAPA